MFVFVLSYNLIVKWLDNRTVMLASSFVGKQEEDKVRRCNKGQLAYIKIVRPEVIRH
jgi:hypothetical protein